MTRNSAILGLLLILSGCTSTRALIDNVPAAIGTYAAAEVFGGEVSYATDPEAYVAEDINRQSRMLYNDSRRATQEGISATIKGLFKPTK